MSMCYKINHTEAGIFENVYHFFMATILYMTGSPAFRGVFVRTFIDLAEFPDEIFNSQARGQVCLKRLHLSFIRAN